MKDQTLYLRASHDQTSISYHLNLNDEVSSRSPKNDHLTLLPERIALYGDKAWRSALIDAVRNAVSTLTILLGCNYVLIQLVFSINFCIVL
jgi:protein arginine N-methyltransferase 7